MAILKATAGPGKISHLGILLDDHVCNPPENAHILRSRLSDKHILAAVNLVHVVITEEDYINFLTNALSPFDDYKRIPTAITGRIAESTIIFVGYGLEDCNFRTIF